MTEKNTNTPAKRKALERQRKRDKGLVPKEIWVLP
jgi:hypothetical protein